MLCSVGIGVSVLFILTQFLLNRSQHVEVVWPLLFIIIVYGQSEQWYREDGKKIGSSMERNKTGMKERSFDDLSLPNQNTIIMNTISQYFTTNGKKSSMKLN